MSGTREEERRKLADIINHWNANRLDLFEISQPTEVGSCAAERAACPPGPSRARTVDGARGCGRRGHFQLDV